MEFNHIPVLFNETIESLNIEPTGIYIDGTMGGGGHSEAILKKLTTGKLISIDRDPDAIEYASKRLMKYPASIIEQGNFSDMKDLALKHGITQVNGVLLDIGVSSYQLDNAKRGFSYHNEAPLDMRMSKSGESAKDLVNNLSQKELADIFFRFAEEKSANRIAKGIVEARANGEIETTTQLSDIIKNSLPAALRRNGHPARKTFQALRIAVNAEFDKLKDGMDAAFEMLKPQGRLAVISFHSLEDRIVKQKMNKWCEGCTCPKDLPVCICGKTPQGKLVNKKGTAPTEEEINLNPRSRSSRLRVIEKI